MKNTIRLSLGMLGMSFLGDQVWASTACTAEYLINSQGKDSFKASVSIVNQRKTLSL